MNQPEDLDPIDALLREQNAHIDDNGFTMRVISVLPPRRLGWGWLRTAFLLGSAAVGSALVMCWLPWQNLMLPDLSALLSLNTQVLWPWVLVLAVTVSLGWVVVAAAQLDD